MKKKWVSWLILAMPYVLTALMPVVSVVFLGRIIQSNHYGKVISDKQNSIEASFDRMLQKLETVENLSYMLSVNDAIHRYSYACINGSGHDIFDCLEVRDLLASVKVDPVIEEIYIYDSKDNWIISANTALSDVSVFFRYTYNVREYTVAESIDRIETMGREIRYSPMMHVKNTESPTEWKQIVEYRTFLPMGWIRNSQSKLVFSLDATELFRDFADICSAEGEFYVYDSNDILIYKSGECFEGLMEQTKSKSLTRIDTDGGPIYGTVLRSQNGAWKVKFYIADPLSENDTSITSPYIWGLVIFPVIASVLISIYFTHKNHSEILRLLNMFRNDTDDHQESERLVEKVGYEMIREYADKIIRENNRYKEQISDYEYSRKYEILDKLIRNTYKSQEEANKALTETGMQIKEGKNVVICICYERAAYRTSIYEGMTIKDFVKIFLGELIERKYELFDTSARETICVLSIEDNENMEIIVRDIISRLNVEIAYYYGIEVNIGAGNIAESLYLLNESYEQACEVIRYSESYGNRVNLYSELIQIEDVYYYPREYDEKIYNYVVVGKEDEAKRIIERIYEENFVRNMGIVSVHAIEMLKSRLWDCMFSMAEKYEISLDSSKMKCQEEWKGKNIKSYFDMIYGVVDVLAEEIRGKRTLVQSNSVYKIMKYVHENYCDNALSLKQISATYGFHENYISNIFKNAYGENLSVYIEKLRIEKACELIKNTDMKIREIAEEVGYTSDASFRRAFKKIIGVSPGEFREG